MNVLTIFEQRIGAIFEEGAPGEQQPFSFRRMAKRMVREMEDETFVIDGVDTAPALYTMLVSQTDDQLMRPLYVRITDEMSQLVEAQAKKRGYTFVGRPLVRFMVDPALRRGRFSVFAENIDPRTLARLRDEENAFLGITPPQDIFADHGFVPEPIPVDDEEPSFVASAVAFGMQDADEGSPTADDALPVEQTADEESGAFGRDELEDVGLDAQSLAGELPDLEDLEEDEPDVPVMEEAVSSGATFDAQPDVPASEEGPQQPAEEPDAPADAAPAHLDVEWTPTTFEENLAAPDELPSGEDDPIVSGVDADDASSPVEADDSHDEPSEPYRPAHIGAVPDFIPVPDPACTLTNVETGETYHVDAERAPIGREIVPGGIVLRDPNVSRRHAELVYHAGVWIIRDLNSTNGTLVNDVDVPSATLKDGDVLTIGLTNLEFRAG